MPNHASVLRIALYQPDIPGNTGTILRIAACFGLSVDIIEPAGFDMSDRALRRAGMDYAEMAALTRHRDWQAFMTASADRHIVLATTKGAVPHSAHAFQPNTTILFGRESSGLPEDVHAMGFAAIRVPMREGARSLNLAVSVGIIAAEALRQLEFPNLS